MKREKAAWSLICCIFFTLLGIIFIIIDTEHSYSLEFFVNKMIPSIFCFALGIYSLVTFIISNIKKKPNLKKEFNYHFLYLGIEILEIMKKHHSLAI